MAPGWVVEHRVTAPSSSKCAPHIHTMSRADKQGLPMQEWACIKGRRRMAAGRQHSPPVQPLTGYGWAAMPAAIASRQAATTAARAMVFCVPAHRRRGGERTRNTIGRDTPGWPLRSMANRTGPHTLHIARRHSTSGVRAAQVSSQSGFLKSLPGVQPSVRTCGRHQRAEKWGDKLTHHSSGSVECGRGHDGSDMSSAHVPRHQFP